jgi:hypothetical protein
MYNILHTFIGWSWLVLSEPFKEHFDCIQNLFVSGVGSAGELCHADVVGMDHHATFTCITYDG